MSQDPGGDRITTPLVYIGNGVMQITHDPIPGGTMEEVYNSSTHIKGSTLAFARKQQLDISLLTLNQQPAIPLVRDQRPKSHEIYHNGNSKIEVK